VAAERGWEALDVLKLDIEGAEYAVIRQWLRAGTPRARCLCVEFDELHTPRKGWRERVRETMGNVESAGFQLVSVQGKGDYTFLGK
jgi:hypothetical protein